MQYLSLKIPGMSGTVDSNLPVPTGGMEKLVEIIRIFIVLFVALAIIHSIWNIWRAGWQLIVSRGKKETLQKSKERIFHALVGLGLIIVTFTLVDLLNSILGVDFFPFLKFK